MNTFFDDLNVDHILHFIRSYRRLEQMPLEDGFAELACVAKSDQPAEEKRLRQHFRNHWYSKERAFGRFYLNLPHYRQLYILHQWDLVHYPVGLSPLRRRDLYMGVRTGRALCVNGPSSTASQAASRISLIF